jgi:hypothetical protein
MSDELKVTAELTLSKDGTALSVSFKGVTVDVTGSNIIHNRQDVATSEEAMLLGDTATGGYLIGVNRDATNYMEIRPNTGVADLVKLKPGEVCLFRTAADAVPYLIANTAPVEFEYWLVED